MDAASARVAASAVPLRVIGSPPVGKGMSNSRWDTVFAEVSARATPAIIQASPPSIPKRHKQEPINRMFISPSEYCGSARRGNTQCSREVPPRYLIRTARGVAGWQGDGFAFQVSLVAPRAMWSGFRELHCERKRRVFETALVLCYAFFGPSFSLRVGQQKKGRSFGTAIKGRRCAGFVRSAHLLGNQRIDARLRLHEGQSWVFRGSVTKQMARGVIASLNGSGR